VLCFSVSAFAADQRAQLVDASVTTQEDAWPVVAVNQSDAPQPELEPPSQVKWTTCIDPCAGMGCGGYEAVFEAVCRTVGDYAKACESASGRYCVKYPEHTDVYDAGTGQVFTNCQTCFYGMI
jgi:hypothetical protein